MTSDSNVISLAFVTPGVSPAGYYSLDTQGDLVRYWDGNRWFGDPLGLHEINAGVIGTVTSLMQIGDKPVSDSVADVAVDKTPVTASFIIIFLLLASFLVILQVLKEGGSGTSNSPDNGNQGSNSGHYVQKCQTVWRDNPPAFGASTTSELLNTGGQYIRECNQYWVRD